LENPYNEITESIVKASAWIASVVVGLLAKISTEVLMKRKLSFLQWMAIVGISVSFGYVTSIFCHSKGLEREGMYIVPMMTLMGEKVVIYLAANYKRILNRIIDAIFKGNEK
jgi:hypothetical protein